MNWWDKPVSNCLNGKLIAWEWSDGGAAEEICTVYHTGKTKFFKTKLKRDAFIKKNGYDKDKKQKELRETPRQLWD